ncbi:MAG TPA: adenylate/guanylate cyclase domain-containing protein [Anaerolineae bacterium]|nr:adenylate/guanylate cyclase domain-containing protein [Anaerolineae bacterium]
MVEGGEIDLRQWSFEQDGLVSLSGEWVFYWDELVVPGEERERTGLIVVPRGWQGERVGEVMLAGVGHGTYQMRVRLPEVGRDYGLQMPSVGTSYALWVDDELVLVNGEVGVSAEVTEPTLRARMVTFRPAEEEVLISIQVSNYHDPSGGIWDHIYLGYEEQVFRAKMGAIGFDVFLLGSLIIMMLYHWGLYAFRRTDPSPLFFAIFCFVIAVRLVVTSERILLELWPEIPFLLGIRLSYSGFYLAVPFFTAFLYSLYPNEFHNVIRLLFIGVGGLFTVLVWLTTPINFAWTLIVFQIASLVGSAYAMYVLALSISRKREGGILVLIGYWLLILTLVNDILYSTQAVFTAPLFPFGVFIFIFCQSLVLSSRFSRAFTQVEGLSTAFQKFVPQRFLDRVAKEGIEHIQLGSAESDYIALLFCDIRAFTPLSEQMTPQALLNFLNGYFYEMSQPIEENQGIIDKFVGDEIIALFDPVTVSLALKQQVAAVSAVRAAIAMQERLELYSTRLEGEGYMALRAGIGIHSGEVVIGTVGTEMRMSSTVLGDVVNVASRLEGLTKMYGAAIIISEDTLNLLPSGELGAYRWLDFVRVQGRQTPIAIYEVFAHEPEAKRVAKLAAAAYIEESLRWRGQKGWGEMRRVLEEGVSAFPDDVALRFHWGRVDLLATAVLPSDWDGAVTVGSK